MANPIDPNAEIRILLCLPQKDDQPLAVLVKAVIKRCDRLPNGSFALGAEFLREAAKSE